MIYNKKNVELESYLKNLFGDEFQDFIETKPEPPAIRINTIKSSVNQFISKLDNWQQDYDNIGFNLNGIVLKTDNLPLSHTLDYFSGNFFYQGVSSQIPVELLDIKPGEKVLDMAAAPGSKTCQILNKLNHRGFLISNDSSYKRLQPLNVNLQRTGATNFCVLNTWGEKFGLRYHEYFDKILLDAPCTALGTLASSNEVVNWWSNEKLNKLTKSQKALLISGLKALKIGGELVYSTCSVSPEENEFIIQYILDKYPVEILNISDELEKHFDHGIESYNNVQFSQKLKNAVRVFPHKHGFEGFFAIKLRKTDTIPSFNPIKNIKAKELFEYNNPAVSDILLSISEKWGIEESFWKNYKFNLTKNRIWIVGEMDEIPTENFVCCGLLLAEKKISGWKLFNNSVTFLNSKIKNRIIELDDERLKLLFNKSELFIDGMKDGYYVLARKKKPFASVYIESGKMKIRLPHLFNLILD
jgi:16S rRNA (cytosine1407-C5)-methyltransferase